MNNLRSSLIRLASEHPEFRGELLPLLKESAEKQAIKIPNEGQDNSWGAGYFPLPPKLHHLAQFSDIFRNVLDHKVWPYEGSHMLTVPASTKLSIMVDDMKSLIGLGLTRIQVNDPGEISFYFSEK